MKQKLELMFFLKYQVPPAELEAILVNHPKVQDAAVVGLPDDYAGELPLAFIVKRPGVSVTAIELQEYVAGMLFSYILFVSCMKFCKVYYH